MFARRLVVATPQRLQKLGQRNLQVSAVAYQKKQQTAEDPIQQLFVAKIREYAQKKKNLKKGEVLVDASPEAVQNYNDSLTRIYKMFNLTEASLNEIPKMAFEDPEIVVKDVEGLKDEDYVMEFPQDEIDLSPSSLHQTMRGLRLKALK